MIASQIFLLLSLSDSFKILSDSSGFLLIKRARQ